MVFLFLTMMVKYQHNHILSWCTMPLCVPLLMVAISEFEHADSISTYSCVISATAVGELFLSKPINHQPNSLQTVLISRTCVMLNSRSYRTPGFIYYKHVQRLEVWIDHHVKHMTITP